MRSRALFLLAAPLLSLACGRGGQGDATVQPSGPVEASAPEGGDNLVNPAELGAPTRWEIDGTTIAEDPSLPLALDRALRDHGRRADEVQDHVVVDLNDDARLDAVLLLPAPAVAGAYDLLVLLSDGESIRVHEISELVDGASFAAAVVPIVDGPTLIAVGPRLGSCERGPEWSFLRPTGALLEGVGRIAVEPYDCAEAEASIEFLRDENGRVSAVELRHGQAVTRHVWDASVGSFKG
ncbi:hypothetical protein ENSA5_01360 [Enhygromyxa salina]|uniref:Lipoprotein n=1 Tax=Enhygromyxa salina TaxID=215803 RepID=A0A2S9YLA7_9BACT|nr:hypothetical protein [Enhygromyxa salina]PRQ05816.1 hypothetical protein ENSA5_01360 [Enhygromyxa salina]